MPSSGLFRQIDTELLEICGSSLWRFILARRFSIFVAAADASASINECDRNAAAESASRHALLAQRLQASGQCRK